MIILKTIFVYIKYLFYLKGFGTECGHKAHWNQYGKNNIFI